MISVIMLTFNREKYIRDMVEDVLNQTYRDFEFIIVDNGSSDMSGEIAEEYAKKDCRVNVIRLETPHSIGYGRNVGLHASKGEFITYVDDDDRVDKDFLEFLSNLKKEDADVVMCGADEITNGVIAPQCMFEKKLVLDAEGAVQELIKRKYIRAGMPTKLISRKLLERYPFRENCRSEDIHTIYKILSDAKKVILHGIVKYHFVRHGDNNSIFTSNFKLLSKEMLEEYLEAYRTRAEYLTEKFPNKEEYWQYSVWSFMISMCDKIRRFDLKECRELYDEMCYELTGYKEILFMCKYFTDEEKLLLKGILL